MTGSVARLAATTLLVAGFATAPPTTGAVDWPGFLGPSGDLHLETRDAPSGDDAFALRTRWRKPLGPGYSGIAVAAGLLYTMASDGTDDVLVCLDAASGEERWRHAIGPTWRGLQGSEDGPMSTPAVAGGLVVGLSPRGLLFALDRRTGQARWSVDLVAKHRAAAPVYGFATSPLIDRAEEGLRAIVQAGGPSGAGIIAFELATGETVWSVGSEPVEYQSATHMVLAGRRQVIGISDTRLYGIDPESGQLLWSDRYLERPQDAGAHAMPTRENRFLVNTRTGAVHYELNPHPESGFVTRELWTTKELKQSYAIPIYHEGHAYGYSGEFLTAIDIQTGKRAWKSRPPGKGALMLLNDLLIVWNIEGSLVAVDASPSGYHERVRLSVLDRGSITNPSFAGGSIYVRNHDEIAAVEFVSAGKRPRPVSLRPEAESTPFTKFVERLGKVADIPTRKQIVDAFLGGRAGFPIVEDGSLVHFVYRGRARDLGLYVGSVTRKSADTMHRVPGTDFWYRSYRLDAGGRYDYQFQLNYDRLIADPLNPRRAPSPGEFSELALPGWRESEAVQPSDAGAPRGTLEEVRYDATIFNNTRKIRVYLPHGYADSRELYPLLIVNGGDEALKFGVMDRVLDHAIGRGVEPVVVAFVPHAGGRVWRETGGPLGEHYAWMVAKELSVFLQRRYRVRSGPENRAIMGAGLSGYVSLLSALRFPGAFGKVATQSLYTHNQPMADALAALIEAPAGTPQRIYMDWCTRDSTDPGEGTDLRRDNKMLAGLLRAAGHEITAHETASGPGWGTWRARTARILETLFPAPDGP